MDSNQTEFGVTQMRHVDRISTLPDNIISDMILTLLLTKDSVRTSVLSSRWKHLYASVPVLDFNYSGESGVVSNFLNRLPRISRLRIYCRDLSKTVNNSDIISWIDTATSRNVQELVLGNFYVEDVPTPHSLFTCETLVFLSLSINFVFSLPDIVCLPKLKELLLKDIILRNESDGESFRRFLSSCPVLEKLAVVSGNMYGARVLNVSVPSLKVLALYLWHTKVELLINCPILEKLSCECYTVRGYSGDVLGSLKRCDIEVKLSRNEFEDGKLIELVRQVCKVQFLSLVGDSMQALLIPPGSLPTFENLTHLELESDCLDGWQLLPSILDSSPRLKTLDFAKGFVDVYDDFGNSFPPPEHIPVCLSFHLKVIRIGRFVGKKNEYKWVEYFLTNALVLEKMEIRLWSSEDSDEDYDSTTESEGEGLEEGEAEEQGQEQEQEQEQEQQEQEQGEEEEEEEEEERFDSDLERYFAISKRLLAFQRFSEGCRIVLTSSHY